MQEKSCSKKFYQPEGFFNISTDALLLSAFSESKKVPEKVLDLGSGCGIIGLSILQRHATKVHVYAVEIQPELVEASRINAHNLGLKKRFSPLCADVGSIYSEKEKRVEHNPPEKITLFSPSMNKALKDSLILPKQFDLVVTNPPYWVTGHGRKPTTEKREHALFGEEKTLATFCQTASRSLKPKGRFCVVFPASRLMELLNTCVFYGLGPRRLRCVHSKKDKKAEVILLEAKKGAKTDVTVEPPLILYEEGLLSKDALHFCPELL